MYYIAAGIFANGNAAYLEAATAAGADVSGLTWGSYVHPKIFFR